MGLLQLGPTVRVKISACVPTDHTKPTRFHIERFNGKRVEEGRSKGGRPWARRGRWGEMGSEGTRKGREEQERSKREKRGQSAPFIVSGTAACCQATVGQTTPGCSQIAVGVALRISTVYISLYSPTHLCLTFSSPALLSAAYIFF